VFVVGASPAELLITNLESVTLQWESEAGRPVVHQTTGLLRDHGLRATRIVTSAGWPTVPGMPARTSASS
jgi:hypothetical protein